MREGAGVIDFRPSSARLPILPAILLFFKFNQRTCFLDLVMTRRLTESVPEVSSGRSPVVNKKNHFDFLY
jgi:hypothetical protein